MDFELSDDERSLAEGMRRLCVGRFPMDEIRRGERRRTIDAEAWSALADAGVFSLRLAEEDGGAGQGTAAATVVFEELGRALVPGPVAATHVGAGLVKGASTGEVPVGMVRRPPAGGPATGALPVLVADLGSLRTLLVVDDEGVSAVDPEDLHAEPVLRGIDPLTPMWKVGRLPAGVPVADAESAAEMWRDHLVLNAACLVGMAAAAGDMAVDYAKVRRQFDRPIGSFQAVKHLCADMLVRTELSRAAVHAAAVTVDQPDVGDAMRAAAGAALLASQAADANARSCIQVYGGMGFTWEVPAHLYLMRARVVSLSLAPSATLAEVVAERF